MQKNELLKSGSWIYRMLHVQEDKVLVIDCVKMNMPTWRKADSLVTDAACKEEELYAFHGVAIEDLDMVSSDRKQVMYQRYALCLSMRWQISLVRSFRWSNMNCKSIKEFCLKQVNLDVSGTTSKPQKFQKNNQK